MFSSLRSARGRVHRFVVFAVVALFAIEPALAGFNISGGKWGSPTSGTGATVTWSLMPTGATSGDSTSIVALADFLPAGFKAEIETAFDAWSQVADITFVEVTDTDPFTGDIRIGGHEITGFLAHANFPGTGPESGDIHFNTLTSWTIGGAIDVADVAAHEIGHSIGLAHATNTVAVMIPSLAGPFAGLFPDDIAGAQLIYGPAAGFPPLLGPNAQLTLTPNSFVEVNVSVLGGLIDVTDSATLSGTIDVRIEHDAPGMPSDFSVKGGAVNAGDMTFSQSDPGVSVTGGITDLSVFLIANSVAAVDGLGAFDFGGTQFGLIDGVFNLEAMIAGNTLSQSFDFFNDPFAFPLEGIGSIAEMPTGMPGQFDTLLQLPFSASVEFTTESGGTEIEVLVTITGLIEATGVVPEPSTFALLGLGLVWLAIFPYRRKRRV